MRFGIGGGGFVRGGLSVGRGGARAGFGVGPFHVSAGGGGSGLGELLAPFAAAAFAAALALIVAFLVLAAAAITVPRVLLPVASIVLVVLLVQFVWNIGELFRVKRRLSVALVHLIAAGAVILLVLAWSKIEGHALGRANQIRSPARFSPDQSNQIQLDRLAWNAVADGAAISYWLTLALLTVFLVVVIIRLIFPEGTAKWFDDLADRVEGT